MVGRWYVDSVILSIAHDLSYKVVDMTNIVSVHQGKDRSIKLIENIIDEDFYWNKNRIDADYCYARGILMSNYYCFSIVFLN